jgi:hypothetical protein
MKKRLVTMALLLAACGGGSAQTTDATFAPDDASVRTGHDDAAQPVVSVDGDVPDDLSRVDLATIVTPGSGVKFHPGHYAASNATLHAGTAIPTSEIDTALSSEGVEGYYSIFYWNAFETTQKGVYDFSELDAVRAYIAEKYPGKRFGIVVWGEAFHSTALTSATGFTPAYILDDPATYGKSPDGTTGGWWSMSNGGSVAWWRPAVEARIAALFAAMASHPSPYGHGTTYDTDPYVELVTWQETATAITSGNDYDDAAGQTQWLALNASMVKSFAHTNVVFQNNYFGYGGSEQFTSQIELASAKQGCALGGPDTVASQSWGQAGYIGKTGAGTSSMFSIAPYISFVQSPDYGIDKNGAADIMTVALDTLHASEVWWTVVTDSGNVADWKTKVLPVIQATPIPAVNKTCTSSYLARGGCNMD